MAARFCPQCGNEVSSAAKFCPNCAAPLGLPSPASSQTLHPIDTAARKTRSLLLPAALAAVAVLAVAVFAVSRRPAPSLLVSQPTADSAPAVTNAPAQAPVAAPPLTNAPALPPLTGPGVTNAPAKPAAALPADAAAYLNFLSGIEQKRIALNNDVSGANAMLGVAQGMQTQGTSENGETEGGGAGGGQDAAKQSTQQLSQGYSEYAVKWQGLVREFRTMPAPPSCTILAGRYQTFLGDYTTVISKMQVALLNHDSSGLPDLSAVTQVQAQVNADGTQADSALSNLCARYGVSKPFTIAPEGASPSLLGH